MNKIYTIRKEVARIISNSDKLLTAVEKENKKCQSIISKDLNELQYTKLTFINNVLTLSKKRLSSLDHRHYEYQSDFKYPEVKLNSQNKYTTCKDKLSNGTFQKIFITFILLISILYAAIAIASSKLSLILIPMQLPTSMQQNKIFEWIGNLVPIDTEFSYYIGCGGVLLIFFIVNYIFIYIYNLYKVNKNLNISNKRLSNIEDYASKRYESRTNTKKLGLLLKTTIELIKKYTILMNEYNASFERILYFEKNKEVFHKNSEDTIDNLYQLVLSMDILLRIPIEDENSGTLFKEKLEESNEVYETIVAKIYK